MRDRERGEETQGKAGGKEPFTSLANILGWRERGKKVMKYYIVDQLVIF